MLFNAYETLDGTSIKTRLTIKEKKERRLHMYQRLLGDVKTTVGLS